MARVRQVGNIKGLLQLEVTHPVRRTVEGKTYMLLVGPFNNAVFSALHQFGWSRYGVEVVCTVNGQTCRLESVSGDEIKFKKLSVVEAVGEIR